MAAPAPAGRFTSGARNPLNPRRPGAAVYSLIRPLLFSLPPETAHCLAISALEARQKLFALSGNPPPPAINEKTVMGLRFQNPLGLAAGFDKNAAHIDALSALGFGFIEVGGVTPRPQPGNARPRVFRFTRAGALVNRMGFNNAGAAAVAANLAASSYRRRGGIIGINLGKNADTPAANTIGDYLQGLQTLYTAGDYFVLNLSSPNTANLRDWQKSDALQQLLSQVLQKRETLAARHGHRAPLALKISPDLDDDSLNAIADIINNTSANTSGGDINAGINAVIAVNTTTARPPHMAAALAACPAALEGGLSGRPLAARATAVIRHLRARLSPSVALIGAGGIDSAAAAAEKFTAGADLIQLYTGLIYKGHTLPRQILRALPKTAPATATNATTATTPGENTAAPRR